MPLLWNRKWFEVHDPTTMPLQNTDPIFMLEIGDDRKFRRPMKSETRGRGLIRDRSGKRHDVLQGDKPSA